MIVLGFSRIFYELCLVIFFGLGIVCFGFCVGGNCVIGLWFVK